MTGQRFFSWRQAFMEDPNLSGTQKLLLHTLASFMNASGDSCYPSVERLAACSSMARETVIRQLKQLRKMGWIKVGLHGFSKQKWRRHEYSIGWPNGLVSARKGGDSESPRVGEGGDPQSPPKPSKVVILSQEGGDPECGKVVTQDHPNTPVTSPEEEPGTAREGAPDATTDEERKKPTGSSSAARGQRLPDDWAPGTDLLAWARKRFPDVDAQAETEKFSDHWRAQPGARGRKADWDATWRNWIRNSVERFGPRHSARPTDSRGAAARLLD